MRTWKKNINLKIESIVKYYNMKGGKACIFCTRPLPACSLKPLEHFHIPYHTSSSTTSISKIQWYYGAATPTTPVDYTCLLNLKEYTASARPSAEHVWHISPYTSIVTTTETLTVPTKAAMENTHEKEPFAIRTYGSVMMYYIHSVQ